MSALKIVHRRVSRGMTLVETSITAAITLTVMLSLAAGIIYNQRAQRLAYDRTMAQRSAARLLEEARRNDFSRLVRRLNEPIVIHNSRTPDDASDDLSGLASLRIFRESDGTELTGAAGEDYIVVQAEVTWQWLGRQRNVQLVSHFAP